MPKKILCLLVCMLIHLDFSYTTTANTITTDLQLKTTPKYSNKDIILMAIKSQEGLRLKAYFDTNHWSIGWGTVSKQNAVITIQEANEKCYEIFNKKYNAIEAENSHLDEWTKLVLTMLKYNISTVGPRLKKAIKSGNKEAISKAISAYVFDANGVKLKGLENRRKLEIKLLNSSIEERQNLAENFKKIIQSQIIKINKI